MTPVYLPCPVCGMEVEVTVTGCGEPEVRFADGSGTPESGPDAEVTSGCACFDSRFVRGGLLAAHLSVTAVARVRDAREAGCS